MGERPLIDTEITNLKYRVEEAKRTRALYDTYISDLEQQLSKGTAWTSSPDPEEEKAMETDCKAFLEWLYHKSPMPKLLNYQWSFQRRQR